MEENFATRLKFFMDSIHVPSTQFADMCEIPRPSFSQLLSGRNQKISDLLIKKIHLAYPDLSVMWLMFGEGPMLVGQKKQEDQESINSKSTTGDSINPSEKPNNGTNTQADANVRGLTSHQNASNNDIYQQLEENKKILELQLQIEKMKKNPRRVAQITVYYDDSTFETFIPSK